jgi:diguanylate cyclase (GGDEF)-like protein
MTLTILRHADGSPQNYIAVSTDLSRMRDAEDALHRLSRYDKLTGLPNRSLFIEQLEASLSAITGSTAGISVFFLDLDGFKLVNDTMGHVTGDLLLRQVAERLQAEVRPSEVLARFGSDEFTLMTPYAGVPDTMTAKADFLLSLLRQPFLLNGQEVFISTSIGITLAPEDGHTAETLLRKADAAMHEAKRVGRGMFAFSSDAIEARNQEIMSWKTRLKDAIANNRLCLYLQPQVRVDTNEPSIAGAELLIRWPQSDGSFIPPGLFIPMAEEHGLIQALGNWILEEALRLSRHLRAQSITLPMSVNLSAKQFDDDSILEIMDATLGVSVREGFPMTVDELKIDKSFIDGIASGEARNLTPHILAIAGTLGLKTVAEGVETQEQADILGRHGCDLLQGYLFGNPMHVEDFLILYQAGFSRKIADSPGTDLLDAACTAINAGKDSARA